MSPRSLQWLKLVLVLLSVPVWTSMLVALTAGGGGMAPAFASGVPLTSDGEEAGEVPVVERNEEEVPGTSFSHLLSRSPGLKLPLTHASDYERRRAEPEVALQQHINLARRRLAEVRGDALPSSEELEAAVLKRRSDADNEGSHSAQSMMGDAASLLSDTFGRAKNATNSFGSMTVMRRTPWATSSVGSGNETELMERDGGGVQAIKNAAQQHTNTPAQNPTAEHSSGLSIEANDVGYYFTIHVGSKNTAFKMLVDSGSADTWITGQNCNGCSGNKLSSSSSGSLKTQQGNYKISYGTGSVSATKATDTLTIAGLKLKNYEFGLASQVSSQFSGNNIPFDGLMGLGGSSLSILKVDTPIDALYNQKAVNQPIVGYHLGRTADGSGNNHGSVTFGAVDDSVIDGNLMELDTASKNGYWEVSLDDVKIDGKSVIGGSKRRRGNNLHMATFDTGTSLIIAPKAQAEAIHKSIPGASSDGQGGYQIPCNTQKTLSFTFNGQPFNVNSQDLIFGPSKSGDNCISAVSSGNAQGDSAWLLGAAFLKNVYFATNSKTNQVGLGKLKNN